MRGLAWMLAMTLVLAAAPALAQDVPLGPLPRDVVPTLVQLELRIDPGQERLEGRTRIEAQVGRATDTVWMHARDLDIVRAEAQLADGRRLPLQAEDAHVSGVLRLTAPEVLPVGTIVLELDHSAPFGQLEGAYRASQAGNDYVVTQMEPLGARRTFPGFDEPSFKQPWDITLVVPGDVEAVANTAEVSSEPVGDGWKRVRFARTEALPSYLVAFAVGPWDVAGGPDIAPRGARDTPVPFRTLTARGQAGRAAWGREHTPAIVHALEDYFGTPYPFAKLDNLAAPDFRFGAMENAGLIIYRDALLFQDAQSTSGQRQSFWMVSAHELAHQWFGNLVTMRWWDDLWLNEAFANWMGYKITGQLQPELGADRAMLAAALQTMGLDSLASTRRIGEPIRDFTDIESAFDGITYEKGGAVLGMIENFVGEAAFRDGVRDYLAAHARGNANRDDLFAAIAARSPDPSGVLATLASFIDQPGVPELQVRLDCDGKVPTLQVRQQRYLPVGTSADAARSWTVPVCTRYADGAGSRSECALASGPESSIPLRQARSCPAWLMPNADARGYYRFMLDPPLQVALTGAFAALNGREQQAYADSLDAGFTAGRVTPAQYLAAVPRLAGAEGAEVATAPFANLGFMWDELVEDEQAREAFRVHVASIYRPRLRQLGLEPRPGDSDDDRKLRSRLAWFFVDRLRDPAVRAQLAVQGRAVLGSADDGVLRPDAVSRDLRGTALVAALQEGGQAAFDLAEAHLRASEDPLMRRQLLTAMGVAESPALAERLRALVLDAGATRANELQALFMQASVPALRPALRVWLRGNFDRLEARIGPAAGGVAIGLESIGRCSAAEAEELQAYYAPIVRGLDGGPLALRQAVESIGLCAALKRVHTGATATTAR